MGFDEPPWLRVLRQLASGDWASGEALAARLGVTRTAVWKHMAALEARGFVLERRRGTGYRLAEPLELLAGDRIEAALAAAGRPMAVFVLPEVDSTNRWLREQVRADQVAMPALCLAEQQAAGRGRRGRGWIAAPGRNVTLSLGWRFAAGAGALAGLSVAIGVGVAEALEPFGARVSLKWPNDILADGAKLGGILIEADAELAGAAKVVVGVGLNLRQPAAGGIDQPFTELTALLASPPGRNELTIALALACAESCERFATAGLAPFLAGWRRRDALARRAVRVTGPERELVGEALGIDGSGALVVRQGGVDHRVHAGEVSLRPLAEDAR